VSTVKTIVKDASCIKERVKFIFSQVQFSAFCTFKGYIPKLHTVTYVYMYIHMLFHRVWHFNITAAMNINPQTCENPFSSVLQFNFTNSQTNKQHSEVTEVKTKLLYA
jgi:hypothetical protein